MSHRVTRILIVLIAAFPLLAVGGCKRDSSGSEDWDIDFDAELVDRGDPEIPAMEGYMGSVACSSCHPKVYEEWLETFHNLSVRETDRPGATGEAVVADSNGNGQDDFKDGLDLDGDPDFDDVGPAPKLSYVEGDEYPYKVQIGNLTYDVWRTVGGNGEWRQRYLTRVGKSIFTLPVQYNEKSADWVAYDLETWYEPGGDPIFTHPDGLTTKIDRAAAFDLRCMGCHSTGLDVEYDTADDWYVTGYRELTIGCEMCHGKGQAHIESGGDPSKILNPDDLADGTANGVLAGDLVCGQCHIRGSGDIPSGGADRTGYPWLTGGSTFPPGGTNLDTYFMPTSDPDDYWRYKDNPLGFAPTPDDPSDDTFLTAREAEMQYIDLSAGAHSPHASYVPNCFTCHSVHTKKNPYQVRDQMVRHGVTLTSLSVPNNTHCLACHATHGDFADVAYADVQNVADGNESPAITAAVVDHMANRSAMPIRLEDYDPAGDGTGRCTGCHMVPMALSATATEDVEGHLVGDIQTHTFQPVWPNISELTDPAVTNSCNGCHPLNGNDDVGPIIQQWASDADDDGTFHADTPRNFQNGVANPERNGGKACVGCHTTEGFLIVQIGGEALNAPEDQDERTALVLRGLRRDEGITCKACHGKDGAGNYANGRNPLRMPKEQLCGSCHNNQSVLPVDYRDYGEIVRHPQREMLAGNAGAQVPGLDYQNSIHTKIADCTGCHYREGTDRLHTFEPTLAACQRCHPGLQTFDRQSPADYDGNGEVEGIQTEVQGSLDVLRDGILATPTSTGAVITWSDPYFLIDGSNSNTAALDPVDDAAIIRAMFNHNYVNFDASLGVHNTAYALQLIQRAYEDTTGNAWPGAVRH